MVVAAGGTAGHVVPAMAVAAELRASGAEVSFLGTRERIEAELVPAAGYEIDFLKVRGIDRHNPLRAARAGLEALGAVGAARRALRAREADVVMGGGGYVAGPAGLAAVLSRTPLVLTEADSHLGLANRLLARRARRVCLAFPIEGREGDAVHGHRAAGAASRARSRPGGGARAVRCRRRRPLPARRRRQPGRALDQLRRGRGVRRRRRARVPRPPPQRPRDYDEIGERLIDAPHYERYTLIHYEPNLGDVLAACDLVLGRSGGSIFEVTAAGRPAILVPYPHATADHQAANAAWMARAGAADRARPTPSSSPSGSPPRSARSSATRSGWSRWPPPRAALARPDAARRIADQVLEAATGREGR